MPIANRIPNNYVLNRCHEDSYPIVFSLLEIAHHNHRFTVAEDPVSAQGGSSSDRKRHNSLLLNQRAIPVNYCETEGLQWRRNWRCPVNRLHASHDIALTHHPTANMKSSDGAPFKKSRVLHELHSP